MQQGYFSQTRKFYTLDQVVQYLESDTGPAYTDCSIGTGGRYPRADLGSEPKVLSSDFNKAAFWLHRVMDGVQESLAVIGTHTGYTIKDVERLEATGKVFFNDTRKDG